MSSNFGKIFSITTYGESHGESLGVIIDGCPSGIYIDINFIQDEVNKRKASNSNFSTKRFEDDIVSIESGVFNNYSTGTPIFLKITNLKQNSDDYNELKDIYRPAHADFVYETKYGIRDYRGGGRASGRETVVRVAAGAVAKLILKKYNITISSWIHSIYNIEGKDVDFEYSTKNVYRIADKNIFNKIEELLDLIKKEGDSVGGTICSVIENVPPGLGEPVFDKFDAQLSKAILSIGAIKSIEFNNGNKCAFLKGSENNVIENNSGILGGITTGKKIDIKVSVKPTPSISLEQNCLTKFGEEKKIKIKGRHDVCICPRIVPVIDSMIAITIVDFLLLNQTKKY